MWARPDMTHEEKKQFYLAQLQTGVDGTWPLKDEGDTFFMYQATIGGNVVEFTAGYITPDGNFKGRWYLTAPDANGSRNWMYTPAARQSRTEMYIAAGISKYTIHTIVNSDIYRLMKLRQQTGNFTILDEYPTYPDKPGYVTLVISV